MIRLMKHKASADYKALRGAAILARYQEKEARCRVEAADEEQLAEFDELFGVKDEALLNKALAEKYGI